MYYSIHFSFPSISLSQSMHFAFFFLLLNTRKSQFVETHYTKPDLVWHEDRTNSTESWTFLVFVLVGFKYENIYTWNWKIEKKCTLEWIATLVKWMPKGSSCVYQPLSLVSCSTLKQSKSLISFVLLRNMKCNAKGKQKLTNRGNKEAVISVMLLCSRQAPWPPL